MRRTVASVVAFVAFVWPYPVQAQVFSGRKTELVLSPGAIGWYEFLDGEFYYALRVSAGFVLLESPTGKRETLWQFAIGKGSGEPNFNEAHPIRNGAANCVLLRAPADRRRLVTA